MQTLLGYTAERSGMALSPAGLLMVCMMPIAGRMVGKVKDARVMVAVGYAAVALGLYNLTRLSLGVSFEQLVLWRMFQVLGLAFIFIPISTLNYVGVPREKSNQISSLSNFARNIGGSSGTAMLTTFLERTAQTHQSTLSAKAVAGEGAYSSYTAATAASLVRLGDSASQATTAAAGLAYQQLLRQASMLSYQNAFWCLSVMIAALVPLPSSCDGRRARPKSRPRLPGTRFTRPW